MKKTDRLLNVHEVARLFGVNKSSIWRWVKQGIIPEPIHVGGRTRWIEAEILVMIKKAKADRKTSDRNERSLASRKSKSRESKRGGAALKTKVRVRLSETERKRVRPNN